MIELHDEGTIYIIHCQYKKNLQLTICCFNKVLRPIKEMPLFNWSNSSVCISLNMC